MKPTHDHPSEPGAHGPRHRGLMARLAGGLWAYKLWWMIPLAVVIVLYCLLLWTMDMSGTSPFQYILY
ncbi:MAG: hypothetical protein K1X74_07120 [Pirellulales bacterium]|nr:hypothetical protein [Pirellulales bacterium]